MKYLILLVLLASLLAEAKSERSSSEKAAFVKVNPSPGKGYQVDHKVPLAAGGADKPSNMQWLTIEQHKAKTSYERKTCVYGCK